MTVGLASTLGRAGGNRALTGDSFGCAPHFTLQYAANAFVPTRREGVQDGTSLDLSLLYLHNVDIGVSYFLSDALSFRQTSPWDLSIICNL